MPPSACFEARFSSLSETAHAAVSFLNTPLSISWPPDDTRARSHSFEYRSTRQGLLPPTPLRAPRNGPPSSRIRGPSAVVLLAFHKHVTSPTGLSLPPVLVSSPFKAACLLLSTSLCRRTTEADSFFLLRVFWCPLRIAARPP